jgi:hypothetical protein
MVVPSYGGRRAKEPRVEASEEKLDGIYVEHLTRIIWVMREKYPRVLTANRRFEEETTYENEMGQNNLADALSHIGTLLTEAPDLDRAQQGGQVTLFEDHLRRSMMEAWEQMLDFQLGELDEMWPKYMQKARPLQMQHKLLGAPSASEIDKLRIRHKHLLDDGRQAKRAADWDGWEHGTDKLIEACETVSELKQRVEDSIASANAYRKDWWRDKRNALLVLAGVLIAAATFAIANLASGSDDNPADQASPHRQTAPQAPADKP